MRHLLASAMAVVALVPACSSATRPGGTAPPPGDHFFNSAATTTGATASPDTKIHVAVVLFDPAFAANHAAGMPGSNPNVREAAGRILASSGAVDLTGTWGTDNAVTLQGGGWQLNGKVAGAVVTGSFQGPIGTGVFAGSDIVVGGAAASFGMRGGDAFDVVVSKSGTVTGVIGGTSGGFITGTASGNSFSYTWQANDASGSGGGSVDAAGQLSGSDTTDSCTSASRVWRCDDQGNGCACRYFDANSSPSTTLACGTYSCCYTLTRQGQPFCACNNSSLPLYGSCDKYLDVGTTVVPSCADPGMGSSCSHVWQAAPAPCTIFESGKPGVPGPCPAYADESGTCAGGNLDACTPPPGGCACPAAGGCKTCGKISACCIQ